VRAFAHRSRNHVDQSGALHGLKLDFAFINQLMCAHDVAQVNFVQRTQLTSQHILALRVHIEWIEHGMGRSVAATVRVELAGGRRRIECRRRRNIARP
jgi:hypothetical protein